MPAKTTSKNKRVAQAKAQSKPKLKKQIQTKTKTQAKTASRSSSAVVKKKQTTMNTSKPSKASSLIASKAKSKTSSTQEKSNKKPVVKKAKDKVVSSKNATQKKIPDAGGKNPSKSKSMSKGVQNKQKDMQSVKEKSQKIKKEAEIKAQTLRQPKLKSKKENASSSKTEDVASFIERFKITNLSQVLEPSLEVLGIKPYQQKRNEEYMGSSMYDHFYKILMAHRQLLLEGGDRIVRHMQEDAVNYADPNDRASQEEDFRLELRTRDRERKLLKKIEESLELIREKEYGYCEVCGIEIGLPRLEARPTATLCIDCKTLDEIKEKQQRQDDEY